MTMMVTTLLGLNYDDYLVLGHRSSFLDDDLTTYSVPCPPLCIPRARR
jgi:hypothetical protein